MLTKLPEDPPSGPPTRRLDVVETLRESLTVLRERGPALAAAVLGPVTASVVLAALTGALGESWLGSLDLLGFPIQVVMTVACLRMVLRGTGPDPGWLGFRWTRRETQVLWRQAAIGMGGLVMMLLIVGLLSMPMRRDEAVEIVRNPYVSRLVMVALVYVMSRWGLTIAAAALDRRLGFAGAWRLSIDNGWRLFAVNLVPAILGELQLAVSPPDTPSLSVATAIAGSMLGSAVLVIDAVLDAVAFRRLGGLELPCVAAVAADAETPSSLDASALVASS